MKLPADALKIVMKEDQLALDTNLGDALDGVGEAPAMPGETKKKVSAGRPWTAELFLPWKTLGFTATDAYRFDLGLRQGGRASYWSNRYAPPAGDAALETMLNPGAWGTLRFR